MTGHKTEVSYRACLSLTAGSGEWVRLLEDLPRVMMGGRVVKKS